MANTRAPRKAATALVPPATISITAEPAVVIPIDLVGRRYMIQPPKTSLAIALATRAQQSNEDPMAVLNAVTTWTEKAFSVGEDDADEIKARLDDPKDLLDLPHILALMEKVVEYVTANPSTSSSG